MSTAALFLRRVIFLVSNSKSPEISPGFFFARTLQNPRLGAAADGMVL
jgi:hypothetical protein